MKKVLLVGNKGQLGKEFEKRLIADGTDYFAFDIDFTNISDWNATRRLVESVKPDVIINCSAYNLVDDAERDEKPAYLTNVLGVKNLAKASEEFNSFLVHFGTDYVFDGAASEPYTEQAEPNPLSIYGKSKLLGEMALADETDDYLIFRVSWLYGDGKQNFAFKLLEWTKNNPELNIAIDEISVPTSAKTVVAATMKSLSSGISGLFHLTNTGFCSRFEWAQKILELKGLNNKLIPVSKTIFNLPAKRPDYSVMSNEKLKSGIRISLPHWEQALKEYLG